MNKNLNYDGLKLSEDLTQYLDLTGLTIKQFEVITGVDASVISKIRRGLYYPGRENKGLNRIIAEMGKTMDDYNIEDPNVMKYMIMAKNKNGFKILTIAEIDELIEYLIDLKEKKMRIRSLYNEIEELKSNL